MAVVLIWLTESGTIKWRKTLSHDDDDDDDDGWMG